MTIEELNALRTPCEIFSRIVGYIRPISQWNDSKVEEFSDRKNFSLNEGAKIKVEK